MEIKKNLNMEELYFWDKMNLNASILKELIFNKLMLRIEEGVHCEFDDIPNTPNNYEDILIDLLKQILKKDFRILPYEIIDNINSNWKLIKENEIKEIDFFSKIKGNEEQYGKFKMINLSAKENSFVIYDYADFEMGVLMVLPKIGMIEKKYTYPTLLYKTESGEDVIYEEASLNEIAEVNEMVKDAKGNALLLGVGIGYWAFQLAENEEIDSLTIVEPNKDLILIFENNVLPKIKNKNKIKIVNDNPLEYMDTIKDGNFDYLGGDSWNFESPKCTYLSLKLKTVKFEKTKVYINHERHYFSSLKNIIMFVIKEEIIGNINIENAFKEMTDPDDRSSYEFVKKFILGDIPIYNTEDLSNCMTAEFIEDRLINCANNS